MVTNSTIFISSTWRDLELHRRAVMDLLNGIKLEVEGMEYFGADPRESLKLCLEKVSCSGVYVGILGMLYGSSKDSDGISFTEREYEQAYSDHKHIMVYLIDENKHLIPPSNVDIGEDALKLRRFKDKVKKRHAIAPFTSVDHLASLVARDLSKLNNEIGKNIRYALQSRGVAHLLLNQGFSTINQSIKVDIKPFSEQDPLGYFKIEDQAIEAAMVAGVIAENLRRGDYDVLRSTYSFRPDVWRILTQLLNILKPDELILANAIRKCFDAFELRQLISIAGEIRAHQCADAICYKLVEGPRYHNLVRQYNIDVTSFNDVVLHSLGRLVPESAPVIRKYLDLAKRKRKWQAKVVFERSLKSQP